MIEAVGLTKHFGEKVAVDQVTFEVLPGIVTGFLGPNGAGKSTTMRMVMGLDHPTAGRVLVNGQPYRDLPAPLSEVGALLEARAVHPGRSARQHLRVLAATHGIPDRRVNEVIELTGLESVADKRVGSYSLGMGQRLGIASALLGDPKTLILDEPVNGLDPEGVLWVRNLARYLAGQGRTVFLSSHLMSEVALTADHVIVIGKGKILADAPVQTFVDAGSRHSVLVRTPDGNQLRAAILVAGGEIDKFQAERPAGAEAETPKIDPMVADLFSPTAAAEDILAAAGVPATARKASRVVERVRTASTPVVTPPGTIESFEITGLTAEQVGELALINGARLFELTPKSSTLEEAYMALTHDAVEYRTEDLAGTAPATGATPAVTQGAVL